MTTDNTKPDEPTPIENQTEIYSAAVPISSDSPQPPPVAADFPEPPQDDPFNQEIAVEEAAPQVSPEGNAQIEKEQQAAAAKEKEKLLLGQTRGPSMNVLEAVLEEPADIFGDSGGPVESTNAKLEYEYGSAPEDAMEHIKRGVAEHLFVHAERGDSVDSRIRAHAHAGIFNTPQGRFWNDALISASLQSSFVADEFTNASKREGADWRQTVDVPGGVVNINKPRYKEDGIEHLTGRKAVQRIRSLLGAGSIVQVPLWHSGFWITLRAPSDSHLIELHRRMNEDKIDLGRRTLGLALSSEQCYQVSWLFEFCMDYIYESTAVFEGDRDQMREYVKAADLNTLLWGLASVIWPRGFSYFRSLTTSDGIKSSKTIAATLDVGKLLWTDRTSLTPSQKKHMAKRQMRSHSIESIKQYQAEFDLYEGRRIDVNENVSLVLAPPSIADLVDNGERWISSIVKMIDETFTVTAPDPETRNELVNTHSRATLMRQYGAWIKSVNASGVTYTDSDVIIDTLEALSNMDSDNSIRRRLEGEVRKYIDDTTVSMVGIPETDGNNTKIPRFENIIPLNVIQTFFILLGQRVRKLETV